LKEYMNSGRGKGLKEMNCEEASKLIEVYTDGELDPISSQQVEEHLRSCAGCERAFETQRTLARTIEHSAPYYRDSSDLRDGIRASLRDATEDTAEVRGESAHFPGRGRATRLSWSWLAIAAAILLRRSLGLLCRRDHTDQTEISFLLLNS
jgi:anti-sigma factor RsiW